MRKDISIGLIILGVASLLNGVFLEQHGSGWVVAGLVMATVGLLLSIPTRIITGRQAVDDYDSDPQAENSITICPQAGKYLSLDSKIASLHIAALPNGTLTTKYSCLVCARMWEQPGDFDPKWTHPLV